MLTKPIKRNISGVLLLDKPIGITSNKALQVTKRLFNASKAGHTGTLDPLATGLLPICFGEATKFSSALLGADKTYTATLKLGYISSTGDADGEISVAGDVNLTSQQIELALQSLTGEIMQTPSMYSALKHKGKPLYSYARKGIEIERKPREITIYDLQVVAFEENNMDIMVKCSTGTYIRTLAEDLGKILGCGGAYVTSLNRNEIGNLNLSDAYTLDILKSMSCAQLDSYLRPTDSLLHNLPAVFMNNTDSQHLLNGQVVANTALANKFQENEKIRLYNEKEQFLGLGEITECGAITPKRLIAISSIQDLHEKL
ncbi:MAG: tRNA pseudouridine(55) synthase TruB [Nitrosomonadaceae bacterium]|nr:tRNA pseudouridine(55) synthase TruB [Nitrosomonadaceae bacterium]